MRIFGSTARGDSTRESDIDIFIMLPESNRSTEEDIFDKAYEMEIKYDCIIDVIIISESMLRSFSYQISIYQNIIKEGIII